MRLVVVPTGTANLASVVAGFRRLGAGPHVARDAGDVEAADGVVLPGVGAYGAAMAEVERAGMTAALAERVDEGRPTLAVCVGMQLLSRSSDESPEVSGLGVVDNHVGRFPEFVRVPQLGWNQVLAGEGCRLLTSGWAYFANSFRLDSVPDGWVGAASDHGGEFVSAMERGDVLACQFHPELSGAWGSALMERWLERVASCWPIG